MIGENLDRESLVADLLDLSELKKGDNGYRLSAHGCRPELHQEP
ncbi:MAG: hypothetical protein ACKV2Q_15885 [Planctomycetaceae bacterium]